MDKKAIISKLTDKDDKVAYACACRVCDESEESDAYYELLPDFTAMLENKSSYVRTRAFVLVCKQARWDTEGRIAAVFPKMAKLYNDPKPTVVRQCLKATAELVAFLPALVPEIKSAVTSIDLSQYKDSMSPLIKKDINELLSSLGK